MTNAHEYAAQNSDRFLEQLLDLIRIPSVSTDRTRYSADVRRAAEWLVDDMTRIGLDNVELIEYLDHHPMVYGEWMGAGDDKPTVLVYGHYDVQPAEMEDGWDTEPFEPVVKDGRIWARGSSDDKGQMFAQLKAVESLLATGGAPVNIKVILEGEEEVSSAGISKWVPLNADRLAADVCVISDTSILRKDQPSIVYSLRGMTYFEMEVFGPDHDLHSGSNGGIVHNPMQALAEIVAKLHNEDGSVAVPGFYDDVLELSDEERTKLAELGLDDDHYLSVTGAPQLWGEPGYTAVERLGARPTLEIHGIGGGFFTEGNKTVLPAKGLVKMSCRLVANQHPDKIYDLVKGYIESIAPPTVRVEVRKVTEGALPVLVDINDPALQAASVAYERGWGKAPLYQRGGGTIGVVSEFQSALDVPVILLGFGLSSDGLHGPNENFYIENFEKGIDTSIHFMEAVAEQVG